MARRMDKEGVPRSSIPTTPRGSFKDYVIQEEKINESNVKTTERIAEIMSSGFEGMKKAYQHPVTRNIGSGIKTTAVGGAGLMGGLAVGSYKGAKWAHEKTQGILILIFPILLWAFDAFVSSFQGLAFSLDSINLETITGFFKNSIFIIFAVIYFFIRRPTREEVPYFIAVTALLSYIALFIGYHPWVLVHFIFAVFVYGYFLKGFDRSEPITGAHWLFLFVVIWDMFDFPLFQFVNLNSINSQVLAVITNNLLFPIWLFYFFVFIKDSGFKSAALIFIMLFYIGYLGLQIPDIATRLSEISPEQKEAALAAPGKVVQNYLNVWKKWLGGQIQYAITGKVEKNQYEPLGVYLENVKSADAKYYENEDVVVWGTVRARTLDDPVNVKLGCYARDGSKKIETKNVDPNAAFPVFKLEEQDFACTFKNSDFKDILKSGSTTITAFADFNFETLAFLKVYFMDRERLRAMTRENLDPFKEFGIKDKKPVTIYTNGPAAIGMETTSPLVGVGESYITFPTLSMSIQNNQGWQGRIKKFEEVILLLPKGVGLVSPETDCGERKFTPYDSGQCKTSSCVRVNTECENVCDNGYKDDNDKSNCKALCKEKKDSCENDCDFLFEEEGQKYDGFALIKEDLEKINTKLAKDDQVTGNFEFFRCKLSPKPEEVLQNTPITTKSIRAKIRYNYNVEKPVPVRIERLGLGERTTKVGEVATTGGTKTETRVIELANSLSANPPLAVSIANWETRGSFNHCNDGTLNCGTFNPDNVNCNPSGSCGVMQINKNAHPDLFTSENSRLNTFRCNSGETAWDLDCNIKSGIGLLKQNYDTWGSDTTKYNLAVDNNCNPANNPSNNAKYKSYTNPWDRALRAYNGFGCTTGADVTYVEEVNRIKETKYSGK